MEAISTKSSPKTSEDDSVDEEEDANIEDLDATSALADFSDKVNIDKSLITFPPPGTQLDVVNIKEPETLGTKPVTSIGVTDPARDAHNDPITCPKPAYDPKTCPKQACTTKARKA